MFKIFLIFLFSVCFSSVSLSAGSKVAVNRMSNFNESDKVILRRAARSKLIRSYMDETIDPCQNFYEYSCGNWKNINKSPSIFDENDVLQLVSRRLEQHVGGLLERISHETLSSPLEGHAVTKVKAYYQSCMNYEFSSKEKSQVIANLLDTIFGPHILSPDWSSDNFDWIGMVARMHIYGANAFIFETVSNEKNTIFVKRGLLGLNCVDILDLLLPNKLSSSILKNSTVVRKYGVLDNETADSILGFAQNLSSLLISNDDEKNNSRILSIDVLSAEMPEIDWSRYFSILLGSSINFNMSLIVEDEHYFQQLNKLLSKTNPKIIANYLAIYFLEHLLEDRIISKNLQRKFCASRVLEDMALAINALYMHKLNMTNVQSEILNIVGNLESNFKSAVHKSNWISEQLKAEIVNKMGLTSFEIGYPDYIMSRDILDKIYQNLVINSDNFHQNFLHCLAFKMRFMHDKLRGTNDDINLNFNIIDTKIRYNHVANKITIPVGIVLPPLYHQHLPMAFKYGSIGSMIAHAYTNEFINIYRRLAATGSNFEIQNDRSECFVLQYNNYTVADLGEISGRNTVDENIGDNVGVKVSFNSYMDWLKEQDWPNEQLPGLNVTSSQLFFLSFAQSQCGDYTTASYLVTMNLDDYVINQYRIIGSLTNFDEFSKVFNCSVGTPMNSINKCQYF